MLTFRQLPVLGGQYVDIIVVVVEMNIIKVALSHCCCRTTVQCQQQAVCNNDCNNNYNAAVSCRGVGLGMAVPYHCCSQLYHSWKRSWHCDSPLQPAVGWISWFVLPVSLGNGNDFVDKSVSCLVLFLCCWVAIRCLQTTAKVDVDWS